MSPQVLGETFTNDPAKPAAATLPFTGAPVLPTSLLAVGLILSGVVLLYSVRRHQRQMQ